MKAGPARPVAQSSPVKPDSLPGIDVGLAVKGQMVAELRDDDLGDQRLRRQPAGHDVFGRMRLRERASAAAAGVFRAPGDQHAALRGDHVEPLGDVFAAPRHPPATAGPTLALLPPYLFSPRTMGGELP